MSLRPGVVAGRRNDVRWRIEAAAASALEALVVSADDVVIVRALLHGVAGDEVVGPIGGSTKRRLLLDRFLAARGDTQLTQSIIAGVHIERAPIVVDGVELGVFEVFFFEVGAPDDFDTVLNALAHAVGLVAVAERDERRVRDQLQLIGNLSHELRTPLTILLGYTDILARSWRELGDAELDRVLGVLDRQARRMVRLSVEASARFEPTPTGSSRCS